MTIYTFGDPELLREVLLALATIFSLVEWSDPGSALGLGGNMLAVALIGLLAVGIAGLTSQQVRVDYLLISLILFGVMFATKVDVNVEDIQTGESAVVADIPVGIASVAAAASSAARSLTETTSLALQRPGSTTSVITQGGFLDPLKILLALRYQSISALDENAHKSLLEYYKICVGRTMELAPGQFDMDEYLTVQDPMTYLFGPAPLRVVNFSTTYYNDVNPGGIAQSCHVTAGLLRADIEGLAGGGNDALEASFVRSMGTENYNTAYDLGDIDTATTIVTRAGITGQELMSRLFLRNFHNTGEAWRLSEYGTNQALYVATMTDAFEGQRTNAATEGTVFLQFMIPLMSFFQFLFFSLAPFVALVMIASPFSSAKVLGLYLLFGVWSYSWMPIAAIINHYMEISLQNMFEFAGTGALGTGYTALAGFDDLYNQIGTKMAIGSNALASVPIITASILSGSVFGISSGLSKLSQAGNAAKTNTGLAAPSIAQGSPVASIGGRSTTPAGFVFGGGIGTQLGQASNQQAAAFGDSQFRSVGSAQISAASSLRSSAQESYSAGTDRGLRTLNDTIKDGGFGSTLSSSYQASSTASLKQSVAKNFGAEAGESLTTNQASQLAASLNLPAFVANARQEDSRTQVGGTTFGEIQKYVKENAGSVGSDLAEGLAASSGVSTGTAASLKTSATELSNYQQEYESAQSAANELSQTGSSLIEFSKQNLHKTTDVAQIGLNRHGSGAVSGLSGVLRGTKGLSPSFVNGIEEEARKENSRRNAPGINGRFDPDNGVGVLSSTLNVLANKASGGDAKAAKAYLTAASFLAGIGDPTQFERAEQSFNSVSNAGNVAGKVDSAVAGTQSKIGERQSGVDSNIAGAKSEANSVIDRAGSGTPSISSGNRNAVDDFAGNSQRNARDESSINAVAPGLTKGLEDQKSTFGAIKQGAASELSASGKLVNLLAPNSGANKQIYDGVAELSKTPGGSQRSEQIANNLVGQLQGAVGGQYDAATQPLDIYNGYKEKGFPAKQAALATLGEVGSREAGASDLLVAGVSAAVTGGIAGEYAEKNNPKISRSRLAASRAAGAAGGVALFAIGVGLQRYQDSKNSVEASQRLGADLKQEFKQANPEAYNDFARDIDSQTTIAGVTGVLNNYYEGGRLTDQQIDSVQSTDEEFVRSIWGD